MSKKIKCLILIFSFASANAFAQNILSLKAQIQKIIANKKAIVGVAIWGNEGKDTLSIHGDRHFPLQSVFKFHIALAMLAQIDKENFSLQQKIKIEKADLIPDLYSPIRDEYPKGTILPLSKIIFYTVAESDNVGCDLLIKMLGGAEKVERYFTQQNFNDISIKINEQVQQSDWELQFKNWTTPNAANHVLATFYENKNQLLSKKSHHFIWQTMKKSKTGLSRIKGKLPKNTVVAHKTGTSGTNKKGISAAVNDIGIVFLPNEKHFFLSVFVAESAESTAQNEKIIAEIAEASWDYFIQN